MPIQKKMPVMKPPTPPEWIAMAAMTLAVALAILLLSIGVPENRPDFHKCPLCRQTTNHTHEF
jgi:hypothetical protein